MWTDLHWHQEARMKILHLLHSVRYQLLSGTKYQVLGTKYQVSGTRLQITKSIFVLPPISAKSLESSHSDNQLNLSMKRKKHIKNHNISHQFQREEAELCLLQDANLPIPGGSHQITQIALFTKMITFILPTKMTTTWMKMRFQWK